MTKYKISVTDECTGCALCTTECADNFKMNDETNKAEPINPEVDDLGCNEQARDSCPTEAIKIEETE